MPGGLTCLVQPADKDKYWNRPFQAACRELYIVYLNETWWKSYLHKLEPFKLKSSCSHAINWITTVVVS